VGVTGGIAAYKAVAVVRGFVLAGHDVQVVATEHALRFVGKPTLEAISRNIVHTDLYEAVAEVRHVAIGQAADLIVIAPATANSLAKLAHGMADDLLGNTVLASRAPVIVAPAMHTEMWENPATAANMATLRSRGISVVGPVSGQLTGADSGVGRMAEPEDIVEFALGVHQSRVAMSGGSDLAGQRVLITAGGTREPLDPVRFLGNRSSGRQGVALAEAAKARGAVVTLIAANLEVPVASGITIVDVGSASEMQAAVETAQPRADVVIMAAAVADYRPAAVSPGKIKKDSTGPNLVLELVANPDILAACAAAAAPGQIVIGFAAETAETDEELVSLGRAKLGRKGCDFLVLNRVGWSEGFATDVNTITVLDRAGDRVVEAHGTKLSVAHEILNLLTKTRTAP
jgi:phosphopantothenoylcysteine decarboxylase/phosphopantothenate--cysteine ligase